MYTPGNLFTGTLNGQSYTDAVIYAVAVFADGSTRLLITTASGLVSGILPAPEPAAQKLDSLKTGV